MRIEKLRLVRYGRFTDCALDFSAPGLHLVVGPNEAGKSTLRSSVGELLYGIHPQTKLDFLHAMQDLRIDALLRGADGATLDVVRLKKTKDPLRTTGDAVLPQGTLDGMLAGIDKDDFRTVFALDHEELQAGGRALLDGKGDLGEALFESRSSARLTRVQELLREKYKALYTVRGKGQALNRLLGTNGRVAEAKRERDAALLDPKVYRRITDAVAEARKNQERLRESLRREQVELNRMRRIRQAHPAVRQRRELLDERSVLLQDGPPAPGGAQAGYANIVEGRKTLDAAERAARSELTRIAEKLAQLGAREDWPGAPAADGEGSDPVFLERLRSLLSRVEDVRESRRDAEAQLGSARKNAEKKRRDLAKRQAALEKLAEPGDPAPLRAGVKAVPDTLVAQIDSARKQLASAEARSAAARRRQIRFALPESSAEVAAPGEHELEERIQAVASANQRLAELTRRRDEETARQRAGRRKLDRFLAQDPPPSEDDLDKTRKRRQELWLRVRAGFVGPSQEVPDEPAGLVSDYEASVAAGDETADRMRREAQRLAERKNLEHAVQESTACIAELDVQVEGAEAECAEHAEAWARLWAPSGLPVPTPEAAPDLMRAVAQLGELSDEVEQLRRGLAADEAVAREHAVRLRELLMTSGDEAAAEVAGLAELRALAAERQAELADAAREHATTIARVAELRLEATEAENDEQAIVGFLASLTGMWDELLAEHGLSGGPTEVKERLQAALHREEERSRLLEGRAAQEIELAKTREHQAAVQEALTLLLAECGVESEEQLDASITRRTMLTALDEKLDVAVAALKGQGTSIEQLEREVDDHDLDELETAIGHQEKLVEDLETARETQSRELAGLDQDLSRLNGSAAAADKAEAVEQELAAVVGHGQEYLRLYLAERLLLANIEAYRQEHQGPVLRRAQQVFAALTEGGFVQLVDDTGPDGRTVLRARRAPGPDAAGDGLLVDVEGMSEGTRDQLYMALRLATLERYAEEGRSMPLLLDDVLMTFDDQRSAAALRVFDELAERFQVILLTHHGHLADVAGGALAAGRLHVHHVG